MKKPELISFSEFLMISSSFDQRSFFAPEIEYYKNGIEALLQSGLIAEEQSSLIEYKDKVAILRIEGPLRPGKDWYFSTGYGDIQEAIVELIDSDVETVIQLLDTPGGTVKQAFETEDMFYELAKEKRLVSLINMATSAGALMTFPAQERYLASKTAQTGSIGVVAEHIDNREWYLNFLGEVRTSIAKGELKDAGTDTRGFDSKAQQVFTESVERLYDIFADSATKGLGLSRDKIDEMQSRVYIGQDGINQGFAQGFSSLNELIDRFNTSTSTFSTPGRPAFSNIQTEERMDIKTLEADHPDVYKAVYDRGKDEGLKASNEKTADEAKAEGILLERKRINEIDALNFPSDFAAKAKAEGFEPGQAALEFQKLEAERRKNIASNMENDLSDPLKTDAPDMPENPTDKEPEAKTPEQEWEANKELQAEFGGDFDRYQAFLNAEGKGQARIFKGGKE